MSVVDMNVNTGIVLDQIQDAPKPQRIILQQAAGTYTGILPNGLNLKDSMMFMDVNPANCVNNSAGFFPTYQHNFVTTGTKLLFDVTDGTVYDLSTFDSDSIVVVWPESTVRSK